MSRADRFDEKYFRSVYRDYERQNPPAKLRFYRDTLIQHLPSKRSVRILDLGCAFGGFLAALPIDWKKYGMDISSFALEHAKHLHPSIHFLQGDAALPPLRGRFDCVAALDILEHLADPASALEQAAELLQPRGLLTAVVPVYDGPLGWLVHLLDRDPTHVQKQSRAFWLELIGARFTILTWCGIYRYLLPRGVPGRPFLHFHSENWRTLAPAIMLVAQARPGLRSRAASPRS